jgi:hypothetical protein
VSFGIATLESSATTAAELIVQAGEAVEKSRQRDGNQLES